MSEFNNWSWVGERQYWVYRIDPVDLGWDDCERVAVDAIPWNVREIATPVPMPHLERC